jgi:hypothetical protein
MVSTTGPHGVTTHKPNIDIFFNVNPKTAYVHCRVDRNTQTSITPIFNSIKSIKADLQFSVIAAYGVDDLGSNPGKGSDFSVRCHCNNHTDHGTT